MLNKKLENKVMIANNWIKIHYYPLYLLKLNFGKRKAPKFLEL